MRSLIVQGGVTFNGTLYPVISVRGHSCTI